MGTFTDISPLSSSTLRSPPLSTERSPSAEHGQSVGLLTGRAPRGFRPPGRNFSNVRFGGTVPYHGPKRGAKGLGLAYEQKVHDVLLAIYGASYKPHPAMLYDDRTGLRRAIPDGLLQTATGHVLVEVKYTHCELAWWQLNRLYLPLLSHVLRGPIVAVEICRSYDPEISFPHAHELVTSLHKVPVGVTGILVWKL